jgi:uncharacterized protein (TIGR02246 family)
MLTTRSFALLWTLTFAPLAFAQDSRDNAADEEQIRAAVKAYVAAFNEHDAAAVASHWAQSAVYFDRETGDRVEGRAALQADFEGLFEDQPDVRLAGQVDRVHLVTADVASVEGTSSVVVGEETPVETAFTATFGREGNRWLILSVEEAELPQPESAYDALQPLAWLVGKWIDESEEARVETTVRWGTNGNFLIRSFVVSIQEGAVREGTQVIGWDSRSHEIRSWSFDSDGSFGDGVWSLVDDAWHISSTQTLADGDAASGTYVLKQVDNDTMTLQIIGHEIEGEPQPTTDTITVVRVPEESEETAAAEDAADTAKPADTAE